MKHLFLFCLLGGICWTPIYGQQVQDRVISLGLLSSSSQVRLWDSRLSNAAKLQNPCTYTIQFGKQKRRYEELLQFSYTTSGRQTSSGLLSYHIIHPQVKYTYLRRVANFRWGGFFHSSTLLNNPRSTTGMFGNNPIAYSISHGIGLSAGFVTRLWEKRDTRFMMRADLQYALLAHIIRPAYGHPYPEAFLQEDNFDPTRKGMLRTLPKSGTWESLDRYQYLFAKLQLQYHFRFHWTLVAGVEWEQEHIHSQQASSWRSLRYQLGMLYNF